MDFNVKVDALLAWHLNLEMSWDYFWLYLVLKVLLEEDLSSRKEEVLGYSLHKRLFWK